VDTDTVADAVGLFLHDHRVTPGRHGGTGHDADALPGAQLAVEGFTRERPAHNLKLGSAVAGHVLAANRVTIHGRVVVRGHGNRGVNVLGEHPVKRVTQGHALARSHRLNPGLDAGAGLFHRQAAGVVVTARLASLCGLAHDVVVPVPTNE